MKFHPQWDVPDGDQVLSYIQETYPDESERLNLQQAVQFAAMYSQSILGEDAEDAEVDGLSPEMVNFFQNVNLTGNPIDRGMKAAKIIEEEGAGRMQYILDGVGEKGLEAFINETKERVEKEWEEGKGGASHNGNWFGGLEVDAPFRPTPKIKSQVLEMAQKLKTFRSFNLETKRSNKTDQDDWGDIQKFHTGLPEDLFKADLSDLADDDLFDYLFMTRSMRYYENYSKKVLPRKWLVLIDDSGSMNNQPKLSWVTAVLSIIAEDVIKNKSTAYVAMFEEYVSPFWKLDSPATIQSFMSRFRGGHGGDTDIQGCLQYVAEQLSRGVLQGHDGDLHEIDSSLEIFIVNDGQDVVTEKFVPPAKTHSLMLYQSATSEYAINLANAVKRSGGEAHLVTTSGLTKL